jgi:hypothetical protein
VVDFYYELFDGIFSEPFSPRIHERLKRDAVIRQIQDSAGAASQSLTRFFLNMQLSEQQVADVLAGFEGLRDLLQLDAIANPNETPEKVVDVLMADLPCPESDGVSIGVAPEVNLFVAGVLIGEATLLTLMNGISWAVEKGVDIISMSLGFSYYEPKFREVFEILINQFGILPVVAVGNENHGNSSSPGNASTAFSVGAVEKMRGGKIEVAFFSSGASMVFPGDEPHALVTKPDVVAPGAQVFSCIPPEKRPDGTYEYTYRDGTSMATPHVAGVAALLMAAKPEAPVADIMNVLKETARHPLGTERRPDNRWGHSLIRPVEALKALN